MDSLELFYDAQLRPRGAPKGGSYTLMVTGMPFDEHGKLRLSLVFMHLIPLQG